MGAIVVRVLNSDDKTLGKRTIQVRGMFKFQLIAAAKVLQVISAYREVYGSHARKAVVQLRDIDMESSDTFVSFVKKYSPIPVEFVVLAEVQHIA